MEYSETKNPIYCFHCGEQLQQRQVRIGYNRRNGIPIYKYIRVCPNRVGFINGHDFLTSEETMQSDIRLDFLNDLVWS